MTPKALLLAIPLLASGSFLTIEPAGAQAVPAGQEEAPIVPGAGGGALARPRIGLALSGGGARGISHLGVLLALREEGIPVDLITGTSMGAIIGGLTAAGIPVEGVIELVEGLDWNDLFLNEPRPASGVTARYYGTLPTLLHLGVEDWTLDIPYGLVNAQRISELFFERTAAACFAARNDFDSLAVPYRAVAADVATGETLALARGNLAQAMRASMAIPFLFTPARFDARLLIDGGVIDVLPVGIAFDLGADLVIAVDVVPVLDPGVPRRAVDIALRTIDIMVNRNKEEQLARADVVIRTDIGAHSAMDYTGLDELIRAGYEAAREQMPAIRRLVGSSASPSPAGSARPLDLTLLPGAPIASVRVTGTDRVDAGFILRRFALGPGDRFDVDEALHRIRRLYSTGLFENVWLEIDRRPGDAASIDIHVLERYPASIALGANVDEGQGATGFVQGTFFDALGGQERVVATVLGGHETGRASLAVLREIPAMCPAVVRIEGGFRQEEPEIYDGTGRRLARLDLRGRWAGGSLSVRPGDALLASVGAEVEAVRRGAVACLGPAGYRADQTRLRAGLLLDTRDLPVFERRGVRSELSWRMTLRDEDDGGDDQQALARVLGAWSAGRLTVVAHAGAGISWTSSASNAGSDARFSNVLPIHDWFRLGGPVDLPGFRRDGLWGSQFLDCGLILRMPVYRSLRLEVAGAAGDVFLERESVRFHGLHRGLAVGLLLPSPLGPVSLHYGWADGGQDRLYFSVGHAIEEWRR